MLLALTATAIVDRGAAVGGRSRPRIAELYERAQGRAARACRGFDHDPGRERRAEQRARPLLKSCVNEEEWAMYRDLGLHPASGAAAGRRRTSSTPTLDLPAQADRRLPAADRRAAQRVLRRVPRRDTPVRQRALPDSDDVLAKWMALTGDEHRLIANANMHLPGRQVDPKQVRRDLWRLGQWERRRLGGEPRPPRRPGAPP